MSLLAICQHIKLSKAQIFKMIQSDEFRCTMLGNLGKKVITDLGIPLARDNNRLCNSFSQRYFIWISNQFNPKYNTILNCKELWEQEEDLLILNEDMNDINI